MIKKEHSSNGVESYAIFSDCERYRYVLSRAWDKTKGKVVFIGLNPSTADEMKNDPTITRMINFAKSWNYDKISTCNLFAFRATFPQDLKKALDPIGSENDKLVSEEIKDTDKIILAWGNHGKFNNRSTEILKNIDKNKVHTLGITNQG